MSRKAPSPLPLVLGKSTQKRVGTRRSSADPIDAEVGRRVRERRILQGVSQTDLGKTVGITFQQIQKYEKGTNRISASKLLRIAQVLEIPVSQLFPEQATPENPENLVLDTMSIRVAKNFQRIDDGRIRAAIHAMILACASQPDEAA